MKITLPASAWQEAHNQIKDGATHTQVTIDQNYKFKKTGVSSFGDGVKKHSGV